MKFITLLMLALFTSATFAAPFITCYDKGRGDVKAVVQGIKGGTHQVNFYTAYVNYNGVQGRLQFVDQVNSNSGAASKMVYDLDDRDQVVAKVLQYNCNGGGSCHEELTCKIYKNL